MIRRITLEDDFEIPAGLLRDSFITVAGEFGLTGENCQTNNAFITANTLRSRLNAESEYYCLEKNQSSIGFIAIEKSKREPDVFYIEKVAVHPHFRHKGYGRHLMNFASDRIKSMGGKRISIALINSNTRLKEWYKDQSFKEKELKMFPHLPFEVCIMEREI
jgi:ribosomal protein S18 acetylase RimI-like enzyme